MAKFGIKLFFRQNPKMPVVETKASKVGIPYNPTMGLDGRPHPVITETGDNISEQTVVRIDGIDIDPEKISDVVIKPKRGRGKE